MTPLRDSPEQNDAPQLRTDRVSFRVCADERALLTALALHHQRTESDVLRILLRKEAERLGIKRTSS